MTWLSNGVWLNCLGLAASFIAIGSAFMQRASLSPVVLSSLLVGAVLGTAAGGLAWIFDVRNRRLLLPGTIVAGILVAAAQHAILHRLSLHDWQQAQAKEPQLAVFDPGPPDELLPYLKQQSDGGRVWLWLLDGTIITATAVGMVIALHKRSTPSNIEAG